MAVNFRDCILGKIKDNQISSKAGEGVLKRYDALASKFLAGGGTEEAAALAAEQFLSREAKQIELRQSNQRQHAMKQREISELLDKMEGSIEKKVSNVYQLAAGRQEGVKKQAHKMMDQIAEKIKANFFETKRDYKTFADGVRTLFGEAPTSKEAGQVAEVIKQTMDFLHSKFKTAGGQIEGAGNYFPQVHQKNAIRKATQEEWVSFTTGLLDREKMIDPSTGFAITDQRLNAVLKSEYDSIVSAGRSDFDKSVLEAFKSRSDFMIFKNADSFMAYNAKFGFGETGLIDAYLSRVDSMSRAIGTMEILGPNPDAMSKFLDSSMPKPPSNKKRWVNAEYRVLTSKFEDGSVDSSLYRIFTATQNVLRSTMLGSAPASAVSDTAYIMATAKINGLSPTKAMGKYFATLLPGDSEAKQIARRSGYISEMLQGAILSDTRFAGEMEGKTTKWLAGLTNKMSGLGHMTKATQDSIAVEGMATIAEQLGRKTTWGALNEDLRFALSKFGLDEKDWIELGKTKLVENDHAKFLITSELRVDSKIDPVRSKEIADKIDDWLMHMRQMAANEATLSTRALTSGAAFGDGAPGSISRMFASSIFMFKSFPITAITSHLLPAIERARVHRKFDHLAMVAIGTTLLGGLGLQIKELIKGRTPKDAFDEDWKPDYKFWMGAVSQGGSMGLFGDFLLGDYSGQGDSPLKRLGGPVGSLLEDVGKATKGNIDKYMTGKKLTPGRDAFQLVKHNIPLGTLWYSRLAVERLVLDNLERLADPSFDRRMKKYERKIQKESGQQFWWAPGESNPDPDVIGGN